MITLNITDQVRLEVDGLSFTLASDSSRIDFKLTREQANELVVHLKQQRDYSDDLDKVIEEELKHKPKDIMK